MTERCPQCQAETLPAMARCRSCGAVLKREGMQPTTQSPVTLASTAGLPLHSSDGQIYARCPDCGKKIKAHRELAGKAVQCPRCQGPVRIPHPPSEVPDPSGTVPSLSMQETPVPPPSTAHVGAGPTASGVHRLPSTVLPASRSGMSAPPGNTTALTSMPASATPQAPPATLGETPRPANPSQVSGLLAGVEITRIHATCDACGKKVNAASTFAGHHVACPRCGEQIRLPGAPAGTARDQRSTVSAESPLSSPRDVQSQSVVVSAHLLRAVEAALGLPPPGGNLAERTEVQPLARKVVRKHLQVIAEVAGDARSAKSGAAMEALKALADSHDPELVAELEPLLETASGAIRSRIITTLGELHSPAAFEIVLRRLVEASATEASACLAALSSLQDSRAVLPILYVMHKYPDLRVRGFEAILSLGKSALGELSRIVSEIQETEVLYAIGELLGRLSETCPVDTFSRLMSHPSSVIRQRAAESLARVADGNAVSLLLQGMTDEDPHVRMFAAQGLRRTPSSAAARALLKALDDVDRDVRLAALSSLGECDQQAVRPALLKRIDDPDTEISILAAEALARTGDPSGVPRLVDILDSQPLSSEEGFALKIVETFRRLKDKRTTLPLLNLLLAEETTLRVKAVEALGAGGDRSARPALEKLLKCDLSDEVRMASAKALGDLGDPQAREALEAGLKDVTAVRLKSVIALGQLRARQSLPALIDLLSDVSPQVKYQALSAIGDIQDPSAIPEVEKLLDVDDDMIRRAALKTLQELGDSRDESSLHKASRRRTRAPGASGPKRVSRTGRRFSLFDLVPTPLLGLYETIRSNSRASAITLSGLAVLLVAGVGWLFLSRGFRLGFSSGPAVVRGYVQHLEMTPDGKFAIAARSRGMVEVWNLQTQAAVGRNLEMPSNFVICGPEGTTLLAIGNRTVASAPLSAGTPRPPTPLAELGQSVIDVDVNADRTFAVTLTSDRMMYRWDLAHPKPEAPLQATQKLTAIAISNDGSQVAGATEQGHLIVWDWETGGIVHEIEVRVSRVTSLAYQQDGTILAAGCDGGELVLWNLASRGAPKIEKHSSIEITALHFPPGGELLIARATQLEKMQLDSGTTLAFQSDLERIDSIVCSDDLICLGSTEESRIVVLDRTSLTLKYELDEKW